MGCLYEKVTPMKVAVVKESAPGERRVALVPETVPRLTMQPASVADGPVHGLFNTPVRI